MAKLRNLAMPMSREDELEEDMAMEEDFDLGEDEEGDMGDMEGDPLAGYSDEELLAEVEKRGLGADLAGEEMEEDMEEEEEEGDMDFPE